MENLFNEDDSRAFIKKYSDQPEDLAIRIYTSRLIGKNKDLVLHGGGNTSVKLEYVNITGEKEDVIFVKGSGHDLEFIEPAGFAGLNLLLLQKLRGLDTISDIEMDNQLKINKVDSQAPDPSVEALLHAFLPHKYVDHTHADSILALTNLENGEEAVREALGSGISVLSYIKSGLPLAKYVSGEYEKNSEIEAVVVINHGIFTFGRTAKISYGNMIKYVSLAESYIEKKVKGVILKHTGSGRSIPGELKIPSTRLANTIRGACAYTRADNSRCRFFVDIRSAPYLVDASLSGNAGEICHSGVITPDHVIRTKNEIVYLDSIPGDDLSLKEFVKSKVDIFTENYDSYFKKQIKKGPLEIEKLDPYPRLFLAAGIGLAGLGKTRKEARIATDIGEHTIRTKLNTFAMGRYEPVAEDHIFEMEYWALQQKKISIQAQPPLQGQAAVITGGAGAIGFGIADRLLNAGSAVVLTDIDNERLEKTASILSKEYDEDLIHTLFIDVTDIHSVEKAYEEICLEFGGIDIVVPNAGIAHVATIENLDPDKLDQVIAVNLKGTFTVIKAVIPIFKRQGTGGNIVLISSKNVFDPGAAFGAYSASKAGAHQISRIAAIELAELGVRVNMVNPDAVFADEDENVCSGLWEAIGPDRMKSRGLDPQGLQDYYCGRSLLKTKVLAEHVGNAVVFFASNLTPTTGAALPVDAGNPSTFSR